MEDFFNIVSDVEGFGKPKYRALRSFTMMEHVKLERLGSALLNELITKEEYFKGWLETILEDELSVQIALTMTIEEVEKGFREKQEEEPLAQVRKLLEMMQEEAGYKNKEYYFIRDDRDEIADIADIEPEGDYFEFTDFEEEGDNGNAG